MIRYSLLVLNIIILTPLFSCLIIIVGFFDKRKIYTSKLARLWATLILKFSFVYCILDNKDKVDFKSKYVVISNHQSFIDILVTFSLLPINLSFFTKKELFYIPIFGWALKAAGMISVNRHDKNKSKDSVSYASKKISSTELSILNYPEGTRTGFDTLGVFKKGGFILALNSNIPILPITVVYNKKNITNRIRLVVSNTIETVNYNINKREILIKKTKKIIQRSLETK